MTKKAEKDLKSYIKKTMWSAIILLSMIGTAIACAYFFGLPTFLAPLVGALIGVGAATLNLFAIGYAFYIIAIKNGKKWAVAAPIGSFVGMCLIAFVLAKFWSTALFGFALGLTAPVFFCATIVFLG